MGFEVKSESVILQNGNEMPIIGYGTWPMRNDECVQAVKIAIKTGYR
jgi:2,5-diketo-D-gluconate reductase A